MVQPSSAPRAESIEPVSTVACSGMQEARQGGLERRPDKRGVERFRLTFLQRGRMKATFKGHPFVFQVRDEDGLGLTQAATDLADVLEDRDVQLSYDTLGAPAILGVVEDCSQLEAGQLIGDLRRLSVAHPYVRVTLAGYGRELPPTVLEDGRFELFGDRYLTFCQ